MAPTDPAKRPLLDPTHSGPSPSNVAPSTENPGFVRRFTDFAWPYIKLARIDGLLGVWLTFWPCGKCTLLRQVRLADNRLIQAWGATLAAYYHNLPWQQLATVIPAMFVGCALLHSSACVWNDYLDREVDRLVSKLPTVLKCRLTLNGY